MTIAPGPTPLPPPPCRRRLTVVLMLVVFAAGIVIGAGGAIMYTDYRTRYYRAHPDKMPERMMERLDKELGLSAEQARQIRPIVQEWWQGWQGARRQTAAVYSPLLDRVDQRIRPLLNQRQRPKWEQYFGPFRRQYAPATSPAPGPGTSAAGD